MREAIEIPIEQIKPNRHQPRLDFNQDALMELAQSIRENGLIQPITVRKAEDHYEIVAGERRYRACILAGYSEVPALIMDTDDTQLAERALVENIQREDLTAIEEAKAYLKIMKQHSLTQEEMAIRMGKSQSTIANKIRLLNLPEEIQGAITGRKITERHARALLKVEAENQLDMYHKIVDKGLNVRQTESMVEAAQEKQEKEPEKKPVFKGFTRNIKIGVNTIYQAVAMIKKMNILVETEEEETENDARIIIKFRK